MDYQLIQSSCYWLCSCLYIYKFLFVQKHLVGANGSTRIQEIRVGWCCYRLVLTGSLDKVWFWCYLFKLVFILQISLSFGVIFYIVIYWVVGYIQPLLFMNKDHGFQIKLQSIILYKCMSESLSKHLVTLLIFSPILSSNTVGFINWISQKVIFS